MISRSDCGYASGRNSTALTTEKIAVLAPMPSASVRITTSEKTGFRIAVRIPKLKSCQNVAISHSLIPNLLLVTSLVSQCHQWIDFGCSACGQVARH
jgi:hypothetical protein